MSVPHALLGLLEPSPRHGYELKQQYDRWLAPDRPLPFGQVYATLARLERDGRVVVESVDRAEGPDRKRYAITEEGESALRAWFAEPVPPEPHLQSVLFTKVALAALSGRSIDALLDAQRAAHLERMRELTDLRRRASPALLLLADYALFHLEADLRWIDMTAARVEDLRRTYVREAARPPEADRPPAGEDHA
jgi:DNA-binding PadR family transcriptional regulator